MKVTLIDFTGKQHKDPAHYAAALLAFTKNTRLNMTAGGLQDWLSKSEDELLNELQYMANTIPSSWEFINYTFMIEGVTRAFTHQLVRTRTASFAQQTMRVLNVDSGPGWDYLVGPSIINDAARKVIYDTAMANISDAYTSLISAGSATEDARGVLPTNILTNIVMGCSMRTLTDLVRKRSSPRTQDEYRSVLEAMKVEALKVHPWLTLFIERTFEKAAQELDEEIAAIEDSEKRVRMIKLVDQLRVRS